MSPKYLLLCAGLFLPAGCVIENGPRRATPLMSPAAMAQSAPAVPAPDAVSDEQNKPRAATSSNTPRAINSDLPRAAWPDQQTVELALDKIRKESRQEYARNRPEPIKEAILREELCLGMVDKDVLVCWGPPSRKSRTVSARGTRESWSYGKVAVWFEKGVVTGWRSEE